MHGITETHICAYISVLIERELTRFQATTFTRKSPTVRAFFSLLCSPTDFDDCSDHAWEATEALKVKLGPYYTSTNENMFVSLWKEYRHCRVRSIPLFNSDSQRLTPFFAVRRRRGRCRFLPRRLWTSYSQSRISFPGLRLRS